MISDELVKEVTKLEKYLIREGREELVRELRRMGSEDLKKKLQEYAVYRQDLFDFRANDKDLQDAKELVKKLNAPHNENIRMNDKISRFIGLVLKDN